MQNKIILKNKYWTRKFYMSTSTETGRAKATKIFLNKEMDDLDINLAVQNGVPVDFFEPSSDNYDKAFADLVKLAAVKSVNAKLMTDTVRSTLVDLDGNPAFPVKRGRTPKNKAEGKLA